MPNTVELFLFHVQFWPKNEMGTLAHIVAPSSFPKHEKMQDGGGRGRELGSALKFQWGREIWFQNSRRVYSKPEMCFV